MKNDSEWVVGHYACAIDKNNFKQHNILKPDGVFGYFDWTVVLPETIGQYTGLCDKNGVKIFEGDIVKTRYFGKDDGNGRNFNDYDIFVVKWDNFGFCIESKTRKYSLYEDDESIEVIGNIYENKELLEGVYG